MQQESGDIFRVDSRLSKGLFVFTVMIHYHARRKIPLPMNVLLAETIPYRRTFLSTILAKIPGVQLIEVATTFDEGFQKLHTDIFDLALINAHLETRQFEGIELCQCTRKSNKTLPLLMLSDVTSAHQLEPAFRAGVNDFITLPVQARELYLRVQSWVSLYQHGVFRPQVEYEGLKFLPERNEVYFQDCKLLLTKKERALLFLFLKTPEEILQEHYIRAKLWGDSQDTDVSRNIRSNVSLLRQALPSPCNKWIRTIKGRGYLLQRKGWLEDSDGPLFCLNT